MKIVQTKRKQAALGFSPSTEIGVTITTHTREPQSTEFNSLLPHIANWRYRGRKIVNWNSYEVALAMKRLNDDQLTLITVIHNTKFLRWLQAAPNSDEQRFKNKRMKRTDFGVGQRASAMSRLILLQKPTMHELSGYGMRFARKGLSW